MFEKRGIVGRRNGPLPCCDRACLFSGRWRVALLITSTRGPGGLQLGNQPASEWSKKKTLNSLFWGLVRQDLRVDDCKLADGTRLGIEEVKIETNPLYATATVLTLGIWVPLDVSYRCAKPPAPSGPLE